MFGVFLKLLIFRVMIARAIKHWLQALHVLVKKKKKSQLFVCVCAVRVNMCVSVHVCLVFFFFFFREIFDADIRILMLYTRQIFLSESRGCNYLFIRIIFMCFCILAPLIKKKPNS